jgi:hypothetical protein
MTTWLDEDQCSSCAHCGMDMDLDPFCVHPAVVRKHIYGLNLNQAIEHFCGSDLSLREPREETT